MWRFEWIIIMKKRNKNIIMTSLLWVFLPYDTITLFFLLFSSSPFINYPISYAEKWFWLKSSLYLIFFFSSNITLMEVLVVLVVECLKDSFGFIFCWNFYFENIGGLYVRRCACNLFSQLTPTLLYNNANVLKFISLYTFVCICIYGGYFHFK